VAYFPHGCTKKNQGDKSAQQAAGNFKRPVAPVSSVKKLNFHHVLTVLENQLDKLDLLPGKKTRGDQRIFKRIKHNRPTAEEGFFHKQDLGVNYFDSIVRTVGDYAGLALNPQQRYTMP